MSSITDSIVATGQRPRRTKVAGALFRGLALAGMITGSMVGVATAAEGTQPLVHRSAQAAAVQPGQRNVVGGSIVNPDGSTIFVYQSGQRAQILPGYDEPPAASYQGW